MRCAKIFRSESSEQTAPRDSTPALLDRNNISHQNVTVREKTMRQNILVKMFRLVSLRKAKKDRNVNVLILGPPYFLSLRIISSMNGFATLRRDFILWFARKPLSQTPPVIFTIKNYRSF